MFCKGFSRLEVPEQTLDGISLDLGLAMKINITNPSCMSDHFTVLQSLDLPVNLFNLMINECGW